MIDAALYAYMNELLLMTPSSFSRYMADKIAWSARLVGLVGPRGIGKSTLLLQRILHHESERDKYLYVSADSNYFLTHTLTDLADNFAMEGGTDLYIDEIHKYKGWSRELKQIYDTHPDLRVVFTGSSILDIHQGEADLSRRALVYHMQGLSFREYLELFHGIKSPVYSIEQILAHKVSLPQVPHPLPLFRKYLEVGYYPFSGEEGFAMRLEQIASQTVESDIAQYADIKASTARKLRRMLSIIARSAPFKPSMENLATEIEVSKNNVAEYLSFLERAQMIGQLRDETGGLRGLGKVEKVYVDNPNLMNILGGSSTDLGSLRETFFYNQTRVENEVISSKVSDFVIGSNVFEVGGKKKGRKQIEDLPNGIIVKDDIEYGHGIVVPLWHFGFNY